MTDIKDGVICPLQEMTREQHIAAEAVRSYFAPHAASLIKCLETACSVGVENSILLWLDEERRLHVGPAAIVKPAVKPGEGLA